MNAPGRAQLRAPVFVVVVAVLTIGALAGFVRMVLVAPLHVPLDPNEGWNAYHAAAAVVHGNPYPPAGSFITNNYPPLSFYLIGVAGSWLGDNVVAGRLVSLAAFGLVWVFVVLALRRLDASPISAAFAASLFASTLLLTSDYVGMNDPQLLGHAFQLAGLVLLLRSPRSAGCVVASAALFVAGGFIKHNLFALPIAGGLWLVLVDRRNAVRFASVLLALLVAGFISVDMLLGVNLFRALHSPRAFSVAQLATNFLDWLPANLVLLFGIAWLLWRYRRDQAVWFLGLYAAISIVSGATLLGGAGVDVNALFDADIALALCAGLAVSRLHESDSSRSRMAAQAFAVLCVVPFAITALRTPDWCESSFWLHPMREETALAARDIAFLRGRGGPAMCEDLTFCYWAGKPATVDVFNLDQQFETGARDPESFLHLLRAHGLASVELDEAEPFPFAKNVQSIFLRNYRIDHQDDEGAFFVPR